MSLQDVLVPDIGNFDSVDVIEVLVKAGDSVAKDDSLITVESDKASMDIPAPFAGVVKEIKLKVGDKIAQGHLMLTLEATEENAEGKGASPVASINAPAGPASLSAVAETIKASVQQVSIPEPVIPSSIPEPSRPAPEPAQKIQPAHQPLPVGESVVINGGKTSHASPSVRKFARELGVNLALI